MALFRYADLIGGVVKVISELENFESELDDKTKQKIIHINELLDNLECNGRANKALLNKIDVRWFASDVLTLLKSTRSYLFKYTGLKFVQRVLIKTKNYK